MGLFTFAKTPVPTDATGPYRSGAVTLKVFCWVAMIWGFVVAGALLFAGIIVLLFSTVFAVLFETILQQIPLPFGGMGLIAGAFGLLAFFVLLFVAVVTLAVWLGAVVWAGWIYQRWLERDPRALTHALILGIIMTVLGGLSLLASGFEAVVDPATLILATFGILLIVFSTNRETKAVFAVIPTPAPVPPPQ